MCCECILTEGILLLKQRLDLFDLFFQAISFLILFFDNILLFFYGLRKYRDHQGIVDNFKLFRFMWGALLADCFYYI